MNWPWSKPKPKPVRNVFPHAELTRLILSAQNRTLAGVDYVTQSVTLDEIKTAARRAWRPWKADTWDCDDQSRALINELCLAFYDEPHPPAAGVVDIRMLGDLHRVVWWVDLAGYLSFWDATKGWPIKEVSIPAAKTFTCI